MQAEAQIKQVILKSLKQYEQNLTDQQQEIQKRGDSFPFSNGVLNHELLCVEQAMDYVSSDWKGTSLQQQTIDLTTKIDHTRQLFRELQENPQDMVMGLTGDFQVVQAKYQTDRGFGLWMGEEKILQSEDLETMSKIFAAMVV